MQTICLDDVDERVIKILTTKMLPDDNDNTNKPCSAFWTDSNFMKKVEKSQRKK